MVNRSYYSTFLCYFFRQQGCDIHWVDDTHALAVFSNHRTGWSFFVAKSRLLKITFSLLLFSVNIKAQTMSVCMVYGKTKRFIWTH